MADFEDAFEDFSVEMVNYSIKKIGKFDRDWRIGTGGSLGGGILVKDQRVYFTSANHNAYCADSNDGSVIWKFEARDVLFGGTPVLADGRLFVASYDRNIYALDAGNGKLVWKYETRDKMSSALIESEGMIYAGGKDHNIYALDAKNGNLVWKFRTFDGILSHGLVVGERLLIGSYDHFLYCINKRTGGLIWKFETQGEIQNFNPFAFKDGIVYFGSFDNYVRAVDVESGKLLWKRKAGNYGMSSAPVLHDKMLIVSTRDGILFAFDLKGKVLWKHVGSDEDVLGVPRVFDGLLYVPSAGDWCMHCYGLDGKELWRFKTDGYVFEGSAKTGDHIIFGSWDCGLYCVDVNTRQLVWKFRAPGSPSYAPPPYESFEIDFEVPKSEIEETSRRKYDFHLESENLNTSEYKSDITYQSGTTYREKGKYQIDSKTEEF
ncbi:MAG: PQQ-binding-like beta-propeller repeat protein [Candidatus Aenigmarchaeota archaeon]|nr:PQQ-binding-like beta-propeller repeat protein [Candidatus Aenigmarchaeota archaeon]